jgi:hypothetical protein
VAERQEMSQHPSVPREGMKKWFFILFITTIIVISPLF